MKTGLNTFFLFILIGMYQILKLFVAVSCFIVLVSALNSPMYVYSTSPQPLFDESQESDMISSSIESANLHRKDAMQALQQNDSASAMRYLEELEYDLSNINGNITNLLFTVSAQPP
jgi:hypothetical protein